MSQPMQIKISYFALEDEVSELPIKISWFQWATQPSAEDKIMVFVFLSSFQLFLIIEVLYAF